MAKTLALMVLALCVMIHTNFNFVFADAVLINATDSSSKWDNMSCSSDGSFTATAKNSTNGSLFLMAKVSLQAGDTINFEILEYPTTYASGINIQGIGTKTIGETASYTASSYSEITIKCVIGTTALPYGTTVSGNVTDYVYISGISPEPAPAQISKYTFQNGWLSVIDLGASNTTYNFDLSTSFNVNSGIVSQNWSETSQTYWFSDSLPNVESTYTNQGALIPWERGTPRNVFGQTKDGIYNLSGTSTGRYLYILNPAFRTIADTEHPSIENHSVTVSGLTDGMKAYVYELTATATLSGVANAISTVTIDGETVFANSGSVTAGDTSEDLTNSFVNSNNETIVQNQGGGNQNTTAQTINNYLENIQNVLDNFVNQFISLLTAPISHIQQLVSAGTSFFSVFGQLFSTWLPTEVSSVIISALVVMIVIGIIKMLL